MTSLSLYWKEVKRGFRLSLTARGDQDGGGAGGCTQVACLASLTVTRHYRPAFTKRSTYVLRNKIESSESKFSCVFVVVFRARTPDLPNIYYLSIYTHEPRRPSRPLEAHPKESGINRPGFELGHAVCWKGLVLCWRTRWARRAAVFGRWAPVFLASFSAFRGGSRKPSRLTRPAAECPITISHRHHLPPRLRLPPRTRRCLDPFSSSFSKMAEVRRPFRSV